VKDKLKRGPEWLLMNGWFRWFNNSWRHRKHGIKSYREALAIQEAQEEKP
jgi:hypothetical protein